MQSLTKFICIGFQINLIIPNCLFTGQTPHGFFSLFLSVTSSSFMFLRLMYFRERELESAQVGGAEGEREFQADSMLSMAKCAFLFSVTTLSESQKEDNFG